MECFKLILSDKGTNPGLNPLSNMCAISIVLQSFEESHFGKFMDLINIKSSNEVKNGTKYGMSFTH